MKKLILTSAAFLLIGLTSFAQDGGKCNKKCDPKSCQQVCMKGNSQNNPQGMSDCAPDKKCSTANANGKMNDVKKSEKPATVK